MQSSPQPSDTAAEAFPVLFGSPSLVVKVPSEAELKDACRPYLLALGNPPHLHILGL